MLNYATKQRLIFLVIRWFRIVHISFSSRVIVFLMRDISVFVTTVAMCDLWKQNKMLRCARGILTPKTKNQPWVLLVMFHWPRQCTCSPNLLTSQTQLPVNFSYSRNWGQCWNKYTKGIIGHFKRSFLRLSCETPLKSVWVGTKSTLKRTRTNNL